MLHFLEADTIMTLLNLLIVCWMLFGVLQVLLCWQ